MKASLSTTTIFCLSSSTFWRSLVSWTRLSRASNSSILLHTTVMSSASNSRGQKCIRNQKVSRDDKLLLEIHPALRLHDITTTSIPQCLWENSLIKQSKNQESLATRPYFDLSKNLTTQSAMPANRQVMVQCCKKIAKRSREPNINFLG